MHHKTMYAPLADPLVRFPALMRKNLQYEKPQTWEARSVAR